jgi:hypothetical protein
VAEVPSDVDGPGEFDSLFPDALDSRKDDAPRCEGNLRHMREDEFLPLVAGELSTVRPDGSRGAWAAFPPRLRAARTFRTVSGRSSCMKQ